MYEEKKKSPHAKGRGGGGGHGCQPQTLYPAPCTLTPTPCTLHTVPWPLHPVPCALTPSPCTLYHDPNTMYPVPCILTPTPCTLSTCRVQRLEAEGQWRVCFQEFIAQASLCLERCPPRQKSRVKGLKAKVEPQLTSVHGYHAHQKQLNPLGPP